MSILEALQGQLGGDTIARISQQIGADPSTTQNAIQMALPTLLGGLAMNAERPEGARAIDGALERDHDGSVLDDLGSLLGGAGGGRAANGAGILGHIFGERQTTVQQGLGRASGLDAQQMGRLLMILAPIVMAYLGKKKRQEGLDAGAIGGTLQQERQELEQRAPGLGGILGGLFGGAGGVNQPGLADDIARMAPGVLGGLFGRK